MEDKEYEMKKAYWAYLGFALKRVRTFIYTYTKKYKFDGKLLKKYNPFMWEIIAIKLCLCYI